MGKTGDSIELTIVNWSRFNGRKDVQHPSWFRLEYRIAEDPDFYAFSHGEFRAWIYIMAQACRKNSGTIRIHYGHAKATSRLSRADLDGAVKKLNDLSIVSACVTPTSRARNADDTHTVRDRTGQDRQTDKTDTQGGGGLLFEIWNKHRGKLPEARELNADRKKKAALRWDEHPEGQYWVEIIERTARSAFCRGGGSTGWKADFDFLLQPGTSTKVLEGKYDDRITPGGTASFLDDPEIRAEVAGYERARREAMGSI